MWNPHTLLHKYHKIQSVLLKTHLNPLLFFPDEERRKKSPVILTCLRSHSSLRGEARADTNFLDSYSFSLLLVAFLPKLKWWHPWHAVVCAGVPMGAELFSKTLVIWLDWGKVGYVEWPTASDSASSVGRITVALHFLFVWVNTSVSIKHVSFSWGVSLRWKLAVPCSVSKQLPAHRGTPRLPGQQKAAFSTEKAPLWKTACPDISVAFLGIPWPEAAAHVSSRSCTVHTLKTAFALLFSFSIHHWWFNFIEIHS